MSAAADGNDAGHGSGQASDADSLGLDGRRGGVGAEVWQSSGPAGRLAESQRAGADGQAAIAPLLADQTLAKSEQNRDKSSKPSSEPRPTLESAFVDTQTLKSIDNRHEGHQHLAAGALGAVAAREAVTSDVLALDGYADKTLQRGAGAVMDNTADQHLTYRTALKGVSPQYTSLTDRAYADEQQTVAARDQRTAVENDTRRDDAMDSIARRYATMASAGLTVKDLQRPALDRLAVKDSRDLLLIEGFPPHPRASEAKALVSESLKSEAYRAAFDLKTAEWAIPGVGRPASVSARTVSGDSRDQGSASTATPANTGKRGITPPSAQQVATGINSMRSEGDIAEKRRAIPPLEDRFNVKRVGLMEKEYRFRDQTGKVAFSDRPMNISTGSESPAAIKAMVDRAAERGWGTVRLRGSPEFVRQGWIAATAQGLRAVGHTPTAGDREAADKEHGRFEASQEATAQQTHGEAIRRVQSVHVDRVSVARNATERAGQRQLAAAIEKALIEGKVSPELRGKVRASMAAEGGRRIAAGRRITLPVYDARAPQARAKTVQAGPQKHGDRERSR